MEAMVSLPHSAVSRHFGLPPFRVNADYLRIVMYMFVGQPGSRYPSTLDCAAQVWPDPQPVSRSSVAAPTVGEGSSMCRNVWTDGNRVFQIWAATRNVGTKANVFLGTSAADSYGSSQAVDLARRQLAIATGSPRREHFE